MMITAEKRDQIQDLAQQLGLTDGQIKEIILQRYNAESILHLRYEQAYDLALHLFAATKRQNKSRRHGFSKWIRNLLWQVA